MPPDPSSGRLQPHLVRQWRRQCPSFKSLELRNGTIVHRQGEWSEYLYHVASGRVKRATADEQGHGLIRSFLGAGDFFGAVPGSLRQPTRDLAMTRGATRLYRCRPDEFRAFMTTCPEIADHLLLNLERQLAFAERQAEMMHHCPVMNRIALMLHELAGLHGGRCRHGHEVDVRLTQQELAELVGASRPVVSTALNDLRQRGLVSYTRTFICIEDMSRLEQIEAAPYR